MPILCYQRKKTKIKEVFANAKCLAVISGEDATGRNAFGKEALVEAIKNTGLPVYSFRKENPLLQKNGNQCLFSLNKQDTDIFQLQY